MIKGKIIRILNKEQVIVDKGSNDGVVIGMKFGIIGISEDIIDPKTGDNLGKFEMYKQKLKVVALSEKISIMQSDEYYDPFAGIAALTPYKMITVEMNVALEQINPLESDELVKEGDEVEELVLNKGSE